MRCPRCHMEDSKVLESRPSTGHDQVRRRRQCQSCLHRFTTYEKVEDYVAHVQKQSGDVEPYHHSKALRSIHVACQKRPITLTEMEDLLHDVEQSFAQSGERCISSRSLGRAIMEKLRRRDAIAYIRFASVYMDFKDPAEFARILTSLRESPLSSAAEPQQGEVPLSSLPPASHIDF